MPKISGIDVDFPYEPYKVQLDFMAHLIKAIQTEKNCVLESPTGRFNDNFLFFC